MNIVGSQTKRASSDRGWDQMRKKSRTQSNFILKITYLCFVHRSRFRFSFHFFFFFTQKTKTSEKEISCIILLQSNSICNTNIPSHWLVSIFCSAPLHVVLLCYERAVFRQMDDFKIEMQRKCGLGNGKKDELTSFLITHYKDPNQLCCQSPHLEYETNSEATTAIGQI